MAKRFIDTGFYKSPFVRSLQGASKALYSFIICDCTGAGIWMKDLEVASVYIGLPLSELNFAPFVDSGKAVEVAPGKFFFPDFIDHQYPTGLSEKNAAHKNFLEELLKYNVLEKCDEGAWKPLQRTFKGPMVMVMVKETVTEEVTIPAREKKTETGLVKSDTYDGFLSMLNEVTGRSFRGDKRSRSQFLQRVKEGWTMDDFRRAAQAVMNDRFHQEQGMRHLTPEFLTRPDKLDKWSAHGQVKMDDPNRRIVRDSTVGDIERMKAGLAQLWKPQTPQPNDTDTNPGE